MTTYILNNVIYSLNSADYTATVMGMENEPDGLFDLTIPSMFDYSDNTYTVKYIGNSAFYASYVNSITLPNTILTIGVGSFSSSGLRIVVLPDSVTSIGDGCFSFSDLESITFSDSITTIPGDCCKSCQLLGKFDLAEVPVSPIILPSGLLNIGSQAFFAINFGSSAYNELFIPATVKTIGSNCIDIRNVIAEYSSLIIFDSPNTLESFGDNAFLTDNLSHIKIQYNNATSINSLNPTMLSLKATYFDPIPNVEFIYMAMATLSDFSISSKTYNDIPFTITPPNSNSTGAFSYTSSNLSVATVNGSTITIVGVGSSTITATQAASADYTSATISTTFQVNKASTVLSSFSIPTKTFGDASFTITPPTSNSSGLFSYTSSNESVATIVGDLVTIVGAGSTTITATQAETDTYTPGTISAEFHVSQLIPAVLSNFSILTKTTGDAPFNITPPTTNSDGSFSYTSSNSSVATIAGNTVTIVGAGNTIITCLQAETSSYTSGTITATFTVLENSPTNPAQLSTGDALQYFLDSNTVYASINSDITVDEDLIATTEKTLINYSENTIFIYKN